MIALVNWRSRESDLDNEIRAHLEMAIADRMAGGASRAEAELAARREFGNVAHVKEVTRRNWGGRWLTHLTRDVRCGVRSLLRARAFTAVAVGTIALGIGTAVAMFGVVNAALLRPLPFADSGRLVLIRTSLPGSRAQLIGNSFDNFLDWRTGANALEDLAGWHFATPILATPDGPDAVKAMVVTGNLFSLLGNDPLRGRGLVESDADGGYPVVVVSEKFWRNHHSPNDSIVGTSLVLDGVPHRVVGVMPDEFSLTLDGRETLDMWVPLRVTPAFRTDRGASNLRVVGRLAHNATPQQAQAELQGVMNRLGNGMQLRTISVSPLRDAIVRGTRPALVAMLCAGAVVLLIACANVANLLLARTVALRRDVAVRMALGASQGQIVRQVLSESVLIAGAGALLGAALSWWSVRVLVDLASESLPLRGGVPLDWRVFLFLAATALLACVLVGLLPGVSAARGALRDSLAGGAGETATSPALQRRRDILVIAQIALSLVPVVAAGLLIRTFAALERKGPGLDPRGVIVGNLTIPAHRYGTTPEQQARSLVSPLVKHLAGTTGVRAVGATVWMPLDGTGAVSAGYRIVGRETRDSLPRAARRRANAGYFTALRIPIVRGRNFSDQDSRDASSVVLVNEAFARHEFGQENPVGARLRLAPGQFLEIIGVVGDVGRLGPGDEAGPEIYLRHDAPEATGFGGVNRLVVAVDSSDAAAMSRVRKAVSEVAPDVAITSMRTMDEMLDNTLARRRLNLWLSAAFAGVAVLLAASGLYAVLAYLVSQRTKEIGIRIALGARRTEISRMMLGRGAVLAGIGIALGMPGAFATARLLETMLYEIEPHDTVTFVGSALLLGGIAVLVSWIPALRAAHNDPTSALRSE